MVLPIDADRLPSGCDALRISTNVEVYWDRLSLAWAEPCPRARRVELPLVGATLAEVGFAKRTTGPQRFPHYDYADRAPLWDTRHPAGWYTAFGGVLPLISSVDDAVAVMGPGEEVELVFDGRVATEVAAPGGDQEERWTRRFVLELNGWCKDMDLYTRDGETVGPMPHREGATPAGIEARDALHERFNTRYRSGG
jgi:hypothetical protein